MQHCLPKYSFRRLDERESNRTLYPGLNFRSARVPGVKGQVEKTSTAAVSPITPHTPCFLIRHAKYFAVNGAEERTLYKVFGIRFDIMVFGQVGAASPPLQCWFVAFRCGLVL